MRCSPAVGVLVLALILVPNVAPAQTEDLRVLSVEPAPHRVTAARNGEIVVRFDRPVRRDSIVARRSFWAFGRWSGTVPGSFRFSDGDRTVTLRPSRRFSGGESVLVILSHDIQAVDGSFLRQAGYSFQFWVKARVADVDLTEVGRFSTRTAPGRLSRSYGGVGADLNGDRFLDIAVVNEDSDDLPVFLNRADSSGGFQDYRRPPAGLGRSSSPSEPSDFNRDGRVDLAVVNFNEGVSVLLGNGDGTFAPRQQLAVGGTPRGLAVLDADGDGDVDIVTTNRDGSNLALLLNDGAGRFAAATFFDQGGVGEFALAAADMNGDGVLDLVVGARGSREILIYRGNGDGTFSLVSQRSIGGEVWVLVVGDLNKDGRADVAAANGASNNAVILLGDGLGGVTAPRFYEPDPFPLSSDLGDLDGDGDLDWVVSSFFGDWTVYRNQGNGTFVLDRILPATQAASCALLMDIDNDDDLDLALIDELEDELIVLRNDPLVEEPEAFQLTVVQEGAGSGTVLSEPAGIDCGAVCTGDFEAGTAVTLTAQAAPGSGFAGWRVAGGESLCLDRTAPCTVVLDQNRAVTAAFGEPDPCEAGPTALCLAAGRFEVSVDRRAPGEEREAAVLVPLTADTGYAWFFSAGNVEVVVKVLDGCALNQHFWVFAAGLTNVETEITVRDGVTGVERRYLNPGGVAFAPILDTGALATCP